MLPDRYIPRKISEISKNDSKVSVVGKVADLTDDSFILDDKNGKIEVFFSEEDAEGREKIEKGKMVRAFCSLVAEQLNLDVAQDLTGLDLNLLKTVEELYSKAGV